MRFKLKALSFFILIITLLDVDVFSQNIVKCNYCNGTGKQIESLVCESCINWSTEYRRKVACHNCRDTRRVAAKGNCIICHGTGKVDLSNPLGLEKKKEISQKVKKENLGTYYTRAMVNVSKEEYAEAILNCNAELSLYPNQDSVYLVRGLAYYKSAEIVNATNDLKTAIKLNPNNGGAYFFRGIILKDFDKKELACADFRKASELGSEGAKQMLESYCY